MPRTVSWDSCPDELLARIFRHLPFNKKVELQLVCRSWNRVLAEPQVMQILLRPDRICSQGHRESYFEATTLALAASMHGR